MCCKSILVAAVVCASARLACGQSFNIDFDSIPFIPGYDAPSATFAGASGQAGYWNPLVGLPRFGAALRDIGDQPTGVVITAFGNAGIGGDNDPVTTGDRERLIDDYVDLSIIRPVELVLTGLAPGRYRVFVYAICPAAPPEFIAAIGAVRSVDDTLFCGGVVPAAGFVQGVTHVVHRLDIFARGEMRVLLDKDPQAEAACVNGMQIVRIGPACAGDIDQSGAATASDIFEYLNLWFVGDARADINDAPGADVSDVFEFLNSWFTGCG